MNYALGTENRFRLMKIFTLSPVWRGYHTHFIISVVISHIYPRTKIVLSFLIKDDTFFYVFALSCVSRNGDCYQVNSAVITLHERQAYVLHQRSTLIVLSVFNSPDTLPLFVSFWYVCILLSNIPREWKPSCVYQLRNEVSHQEYEQ